MTAITKEIVETSRVALIAALDARISHERDVNGGEKTVSQLQNYRKKAINLDAFTLGGAVVRSLDWDANINSHRRTGDRFNVYAISKLWEALRVSEGSTFNVATGDGATLAATLQALVIGITNQKIIEGHVNDTVTAIRTAEHNADPAKVGSAAPRYTSGNTQASSSLRALEALGIVTQTGRDGSCKLWQLVPGDDATVCGSAAVAAINAALGIVAPPAPKAPRKRATKSAPVVAPVVPQGWQEVDTSNEETASN